MKSNHLLTGLAVAVLVGAVWAAMLLLRTSPSAGADGGAGPEQPPALSETHLKPVTSAAGEASTAVAERAREAVEAQEVAGSDSWSAHLGGLTGRVVEEDLTPVTGISVALLQADASLLLTADWTLLGEQPPSLVLDRTLTDEEGRFRLGGAYDAAFQGLGIDLRGPRGTLRVVDAQLHQGETTDIGDIVLAGGCEIHGRVVDAGGQPVAGARVRIVPAPDEDLSVFLQIGVQDFRADCSVGIASVIENGGPSPVIDLPQIVREHIDDLPIPTTTTDAEGGYRIEHVPVGALIQGIDKPGLVGVSRVVTTVAGTNELPEATLTAGRTVQGVVVDMQGKPVQGAEVLAGSELSIGEVAILHAAGTTGPDGRFTLSGCPPTGMAMACARRSPDESWVGMRGPADEELEIELESTVTLTVHLADVAGEAVSGAVITIAPAVDEDWMMEMFGPLQALDSAPRVARFTEVAKGDYACDRVAPGRYEVTARPPGLAPVRDGIELQGDAELDLVCQRGQELDVTVTDAGTGKGIAGARASIIATTMFLPQSLAVGRTGSDGHVRLGPYAPQEPDEARERMFGARGLGLLVQHPAYADVTLPVTGSEATLQVALMHGGEIRGRIQWGGSPPQSIYMLVLEYSGSRDGLGEMFQPPRLGRSDLGGEFRFTNLPAGSYRLQVFDRFLDGDPIRLIMAQESPTLVHREDDVQLEPAGQVELVIDLSPSGRGQTARVAGSVFCDSRPVVGAEVDVYGSGGYVSAQTDPQGDFETPEFLALGEMHLQIRGDIELSGRVVNNVPLHEESFTPLPQTVHRVDVGLLTRPMKVHVVDSTGSGVAQAEVTLSSADGGGQGQSTRTDDQGHAQLALFGQGEHVVRATAEGYATGSAPVDVADGHSEVSVEITLRKAVACAGLCDLTAFGNLEYPDGVFLLVEGPGGSDWVHLEPDDLGDDGRASFQVDGLGPGSHTARLWMRGSHNAEEISLELPEGGDENLLLVFRPASGG